MSSKPRKRKSKSKSISPLTIILLVALVLAFFYVNKQDSTSKEADRPTPDFPAKPKTDANSRQLMAVNTPAKTIEQIIDYPGFTVSFNKKHHQPNWVAWELTPGEVRSNVVGRRSDKFAPDPEIEGCPELNDYRNSGYDRGHMAPAADMNWSAEASAACFLLTNMCPQANSLNANAWRVLEESCRRWALRDSNLIIICGPILTDKITRHIGKSKVSVPERFFKVILAPYADPPRAIGFIMPNTKVNGGIQTSVVSVDKVEKITGFDFFSALPDDIENEIEAKSNFPQWNQRK